MTSEDTLRAPPSISSVASPCPLHPIAWARSATCNAVARIGQLTPIERKAAAADALGEAGLEPFELGDAVANPRGPTGREFRPVGALGHAIGRQLRQLLRDLLERQPDPLRKDDECDPPEDPPRIPAMAGAVALRLNQPTLFVETQRGACD